MERTKTKIFNIAKWKSETHTHTRHNTPYWRYNDNSTSFFLFLPPSCHCVQITCFWTPPPRGRSRPRRKGRTSDPVNIQVRPLQTPTTLYPTLTIRPDDYSFLKWPNPQSGPWTGCSTKKCQVRDHLKRWDWPQIFSTLRRFTTPNPIVNGLQENGKFDIYSNLRHGVLFGLYQEVKRDLKVTQNVGVFVETELGEKRCWKNKKWDTGTRPYIGLPL